MTLVRALAHAGLTRVRDFSDPTALPLLPPAWRLIYRYVLWRTKGRIRRQGPSEPSGPRSDLVPLRTRVLDAAWHEAHARGTRQLVLLGAGLDGRAFRLEDVGDSALFEVDHPLTQRLKRERAAQLTSKAGRLVYVPVDFERDALAEALETSGQSKDAPTFWIWEGVTPYLTRPAQVATLAAIAERSAPKSRLAMTYTEPSEAKKEGAALRRLVRLFGEPFLGLMTQHEAAGMLEAAGFRMVEDIDIQEWRRRYSTKPDVPEQHFPQRIAVAEKVPTPTA